MNEEVVRKSVFDRLAQIMLPAFTILGFLLTSLKKPHIGLLFSLCGQVFWLYSGWKAWQEAGQIGIFVTVVIVTLIILGGVVNYWLF